MTVRSSSLTSTTVRLTMDSSGRKGTGILKERGLSGRSVRSQTFAPSPTSGASKPSQRANRQPSGTASLSVSPGRARSGWSGGAGSASATPVVEQVVVVYEPLVAATVGPFSTVAETTGGDIPTRGPGHLGVSGASGVSCATEAIGWVGDAVAAGIGDRLGLRLGVGLGALVRHAAVAATISVRNMIGRSRWPRRCRPDDSDGSPMFV